MQNFHNDCCHPWTKSFQELVFKAVKNHKSSGYRDCQQVGSIDRNLIFLQTTVIHFETMMTTVDEVNSNKTKVPEEFIKKNFRSVFLDCFTAKLDE